MSLAKPALQVQYPTEEGVTNIADMIEKELCQAAGKEAVVRIHSDNALELVTKKNGSADQCSKHLQDGHGAIQPCFKWARGEGSTILAKAALQYLLDQRYIGITHPLTK